MLTKENTKEMMAKKDKKREKYLDEAFEEVLKLMPLGTSNLTVIKICDIIRKAHSHGEHNMMSMFLESVMGDVTQEMKDEAFKKFAGVD